MASSPSFQDVMQRYQEKISKFCDGINPYELDIKSCVDPLPNNVNYCDIINYCLYQQSSYTLNEFRNYKAIESYKFYESGWIRNVGCKKTKIGWIVIALVNI